MALSTVYFIVGDVTCKATIPSEMEVEAYFLAKEDGIIAGIALAEMIFHEVDPSLRVWNQPPWAYIICVGSTWLTHCGVTFEYQVEWSQKDGDYIHKGLQFGKVHGNKIKGKRRNKRIRKERRVISSI